MPTLDRIAPASASGETAALYVKAKETLGGIPNMATYLAKKVRGIDPAEISRRPRRCLE